MGGGCGIVWSNQGAANILKVDMGVRKLSSHSFSNICLNTTVGHENVSARGDMVIFAIRNTSTSAPPPPTAPPVNLDISLNLYLLEWITVNS